MVDQYFGSDSLEPFESIFIGSTVLVMAYIWLQYPCKWGGGGTMTFFYMVDQYFGNDS